MAVVWIAVVILAQSAHFPTRGEERKMCPRTMSWKAGGVFGTPLALKPPSNPFTKRKKEELAYGLCRPFGISSLPAA